MLTLQTATLYRAGTQHQMGGGRQQADHQRYRRSSVRMERADRQAGERVGAEDLPVQLRGRQSHWKAHVRRGKRQDHQGDH